MTGQYLLFSVVGLRCLTDIQPMSRQALFTLHSDEECYSGASVVCLCSWQLTQLTTHPASLQPITVLLVRDEKWNISTTPHKSRKRGIIKANNACRALHLKNIYNCFRSLFSTFTCLLWSDVHLQLSHCLDCLVYKWFSCSEEETAIGWKAMKYGIFIFLAGWIVITFPYDPLSFSAKRRVILSLSW